MTEAARDEKLVQAASRRVTRNKGSTTAEEQVAGLFVVKGGARVATVDDVNKERFQWAPRLHEVFGR